MINVTDLSSYMWCPRKLYLTKVEKLRIPKKAPLIKGIIKHEVIEKLNLIEKQIIQDIKKPTKLTDIEQTYQDNYKQLFLSIIEENQEQLQEFKIGKKEFFEQSWFIYQNEAAERAVTLSDFIEKNKLFGTELWNSIEPKYVTEFKIVSKNLKIKGKIDKLEIYKDKVIPIEMKSGKMPDQGVWPQNKIQLIAYCLLAKEHFKKQTDYGYVHYMDHNQKRKIILNPFSKIDFFNIRDQILSMIETRTPPQILNNKKCDMCEFKEQCQSLK